MIIPSRKDLISTDVEMYYLQWGVLNAYFKRRKMFYMIKGD